MAAAVLSRQPELRGAGAPLGAGQLPRVAAAGGGVRARRPGGHRPRHASRSAPARTASRCSCGTSGRSPKEIADAMAAALKPELFRERYASVFDGDEAWQALPVPEGSRYAWDPNEHLRRRSRRSSRTSRPSRRRSGTSAGRGCWPSWAIRSPPTTSRRPGSIPKNGPAARYLLEHGVAQADWNTFGARRGNHEVMMRGTFGNVRIKNALVPDKEGNWTVHFPQRRGDVHLRRGHEVHQADGTPLVILSGQGIRHRLEPRLGRQGPRAAGREGGDRRELRADPPEQPGGHGRAAAAAMSRAAPASRSASPGGRRSASPASPRGSPPAAGCR